MATGQDADGNEPKKLMADLSTVLSDPEVSIHDKMRLVMLYIISQEGLSEKVLA